MLLDDIAALRPSDTSQLRLVVIAQIARRLLGGVRVASALERRVHFPLMVRANSPYKISCSSPRRSRTTGADLLIASRALIQTINFALVL